MLFDPGPLQPTERICRNCGARVAPEYRYCINCGTPYAPFDSAAVALCPNCRAPLQSNYRYCTNCGADVSGITGVAWAPAPGNYPVRFDVQYPQKLSRLTTFFRLILAIPQLLIVYALSTVVSVVTFISFFVILFTRRYPKGLFDLVVGFNRWIANVNSYVYLFRDEYPPFSTDPGRYAVLYEVDYPERLNRWLIFVKWLLAIPNQLVVGLLGIISALLTFLAWWIILFTGRFPRGFFDFNVGVMRWSLRVSAYTNLLRDEYPPYSMRADAMPSGAKAIAIGAVAGILALAVLIAGIVALSTIDPQTETVIVNYESLESGSPQRPVRIEGTRVTLSGVQDPYLRGVFERASGSPRGPETGSRFVAFDMTIINVDSLFSSVSKSNFRLEDSFGDEHTAIATVPFIIDTDLEEGERMNLLVVFEIDEFGDPVSLTYSPGFAAYLPFGERVRFEFR